MVADENADSNPLNMGTRKPAVVIAKERSIVLRRRGNQSTRRLIWSERENKRVIFVTNIYVWL
jgi:hypothetical protein